MKKTTWIVGALLLTALLGLALLPAAIADEDDDERRPIVLETRIYRVGALTMGKRSFIGETPPPVLPADMADEENPLFGAEAEEPVFPVGQVDELIELCKGAVDPAFWERTEGADMRSLGEGHLVVRATAPVHGAMARFLARFESRVLRSTRVEVRAVPVEGGRAIPADQAGLEALLAGPDAGPALSFVAWDNQRVSAVGGRQYAYLVDYDVSVAQESTISDPGISVANLGLMVDVLHTPTGSGGNTLVDAWIRLADLAAPRAVPTGEHRTVEAPAFEKVVVHSLVDAPAGEWISAGGGGDWAFFMRVTPASYEAQPAETQPLPAPTPAGGKFELRYFPVTDLGMSAWPTIAWPNHLWPSSFRSPEPPELREPTPFCAPEQLVELVREQGRGDWWEDPASMEARNGILIARNDPGVLANIERLLASLRAQFLWSVKTKAEVVEMPAALARTMAGKGASAHVLDDAGMRALGQARRDGRVHTVASAEVLNRRSSRNAVSAGRRISYLQDFAVEIAQGAAIANPVIKVILSGLQLDLRLELTSAGDAVALEVRFQRSEVEEPMRKLETPDGALELPELDVFRVRTGLVVPLGKTVMLASRGEGEHRQVLLLTPTLERTR